MKNFAILVILTCIAATSYSEDFLFEAPCSDDEDKAMEDMLIPDLVSRLSDQAYTAMGMMEQFRDEYAKTLTDQVDFDSLINTSEGKDWLRKFDWYQDEVLPKEKEIGIMIRGPYLEIFHNNSEKILPRMHKATKMILASFMELRHDLDSYPADQVQYMKNYIDDTVDSLHGIVCTFRTFILANDEGRILPLTPSEIKITKETYGLLFIDTINFLEYLSQVALYEREDIDKTLCEVKTSIGLPCTPDWYGPEYIVDNNIDTVYNVTIVPYEPDD